MEINSNENKLQDEEHKKEYTRCLRCGRILKNPICKELGMGKTCYNKYKKEQLHKKLF